MGDQTSRKHRRYSGHDALKNDNKFGREKSPCMQKTSAQGLCSFCLCRRPREGLQQLFEAFDVPIGKLLDLRFILFFVFIGNGNDVKIGFLGTADS